MRSANRRGIYRRIFRLLLRRFGPRHWWPARTRFEVIVGAVLTQNTSWKNAAAAIANLRRAGVLNYRALRAVPAARLARLIRPALYYNIKAGYLKNVMRFLEENGGGNLNEVFRIHSGILRSKILEVKGVGEETADSILLYAGDIPTFVVDAYTRRIYSRLGLLGGGESYGNIKGEFEGYLPRRAALYNEYHALITTFGHRLCRKRPLCADCPLRDDAALQRMMLRAGVKGCLSNS